MLSKSFNPYQFSSDGLIKASGNQHYKVTIAWEAMRAGCGVMPTPRPNPLHALLQVSQDDIITIKTLGRGASSLVGIASSAVHARPTPRMLSHPSPAMHPRPAATRPCPRDQVYKGFLHTQNRFVAVKKISIFEKVRGPGL